MCCLFLTYRTFLDHLLVPASIVFIQHFRYCAMSSVSWGPQEKRARREPCHIPIFAILLPPSHKSKKMLPIKRDTSQSHTEGPNSGPALALMSFKVGRLLAAKQQLIADLRHRLQCVVVCMQDTHRGPDDIRPSIPGMDLAIERLHSQYCSATFVTSGTIVNTTPLTDSNNIDILR